MLLLLAGPDLPERATPSPLSIEPSNPGRHQRRGVALVAAKLGNMRRPTIDKNMLGVLSGENFRKYLESQIASTDKAVVRRCTEVLGRTIQICGGDFFIRRFHKDGYIIWRLLALSPFRRKTLSLMDERAIILPYRNTSLTSEEPMAEISSQKIQTAVLDMITEISSNKRSAIALESVLKKICGLVVGIAYGGLIGLREAAIRALTGLACMDADLVWLLLADVYHSLNQRDMPVPPIQDLVALCDLLPPPMSSREYLFVQYGGEGVRYDIDLSSVYEVFKRMEDTVFK